jgi:hypothetical protein
MELKKYNIFTRKGAESELYDLCFKSAHLKRYNLEPKRKVLDYESVAQEFHR